VQPPDGPDEQADTALVPATELASAALALARRFAAGATLWCCAPRWPEHARHVAVEFVHPVIMGARALPAIAVTDPEPVVTLRAAVRSGDVVVAVGPSDDEVIADALRRASAWGATSIWIGCGPRVVHAADHVLWDALGDDDAAHDGTLVRLYHLLWELTHVCFEHPGLLRDEACTDEVCITCSDEGRPGEVVGLDGLDAIVRTARGVERVDVSLLDPVAADDLVLVHAGTAIARMDGAR